MSVPPLLGPGLVARSIRVRRGDVVYLKNVFEARDGLAVVFAQRGGDLLVATTPSLAAEADELLEDLAAEMWIEFRGDAFR